MKTTSLILALLITGCTEGGGESWSQKYSRTFKESQDYLFTKCKRSQYSANGIAIYTCPDGQLYSAKEAHDAFFDGYLNP
jgi:hypothetical protein